MARFYPFLHDHTVEKKCKFQVETHPDSCQHFEQFLIANTLRYTKIECSEHELSDSNAQHAQNPFIGIGSHKDYTELAHKLSQWFSHNKHLCMAHFAGFIISGSVEYLQELMSGELSSEGNRDEEQSNAWVKIEHFLRNERLQKALTCSCHTLENSDRSDAGKNHSFYHFSLFFLCLLICFINIFILLFPGNLA